MFIWIWWNAGQIDHIDGEQRNGREVIFKRVGSSKQVDPISSSSSASKSKGFYEKISSKFSSETENSNSSHFTLPSAIKTIVFISIFIAVLCLIESNWNLIVLCLLCVFYWLEKCSQHTHTYLIPRSIMKSDFYQYTFVNLTNIWIID